MRKWLVAALVVIALLVIVALALLDAGLGIFPGPR